MCKTLCIPILQYMSYVYKTQNVHTVPTWGGHKWREFTSGREFTSATVGCEFTSEEQTNPWGCRHGVRPVLTITFQQHRNTCRWAWAHIDFLQQVTDFCGVRFSEMYFPRRALKWTHKGLEFMGVRVYIYIYILPIKNPIYFNNIPVNSAICF